MIQFLSGIPDEYVLLAVSVILFAESGLLVGVFLPGSGTALALGFLTGQHVVDVWPSVLAAGLASGLGAQYGYFRGSRGWLARRAVERLGPARAARLESSLDRRAGLTVAVAQCVGVVRTLSPRLAGRMRVPYRRFVTGTAPVALSWSTVLVLLGNSSGSAYRHVEAVVGLLGLPVLVVLVVAVFVVRWWRGRSSGSAGSGGSGASAPADAD